MYDFLEGAGIVLMAVLGVVVVLFIVLIAVGLLMDRNPY
jgi:hypothetical protein